MITRCLSSNRPSSLTVHIYDFFFWKCRTEFNETWQETRSYRPLPSLCFSGRSEKQDGRPDLWLPETCSTPPLKPLNGIQRNLTESNISTSSTKFVFWSIGKTRWPPGLVPEEVLWSLWGSHQTLWSLPLPNVTRHSGTWPYTMTPSIDQTLHQFANVLPNWTLIPILTLLPNFGGFHRTLQRVRLANRGRLLLQTPGPVPFGTCICSNVETILSWTCRVFGPLEFRTSLGTSILLTETFSTSPLKFNKNWQKARSQRPLPSVCFFGPIRM